MEVGHWTIRHRFQHVLDRKTAAGARIHPAAHPQLIATSSERGDGIAQLRAAILAAATGQ